ncbi:MAG: aldo/keto reductase [Synergistaceae bacterium]|jgi:predicted aldo/keto reductase-like oxidoreductase|nr:aldo/keto reductase [Synergistaceae bacterium]
METRTYKNSDERISLLGFGCMRFPLIGDTQEIDREHAARMVDHAIANGVNYFDTAYVYHQEKSELLIGEALKRYPRGSFNLADKLPTWFVERPEDVPRLFDEQLKRCQVEYFDYFLVHNINEERLKIVVDNRVYEQLKEIQKRGAIRHLGFSFHDRPEVLEKIVDMYDWDFTQIQFNYVDWEQQDARSQYLILRERGIPVVVMEPVRGGALASLCDEAVSILKEAAPNESQASWAIRYAASFPEVLTVLSGMSEMSQLEDNLRTVRNFRPISPYEHEVLGRALSAYKLASTIPCTSCRYCMDCPAGVDIPKVLMIYNNYCRRKGDPRNEMVISLEYGILGEKFQAHHCVSCGACVKHCPQRIDIPQWMHTVTELIDGIKAAS